MYLIRFLTAVVLVNVCSNIWIVAFDDPDNHAKILNKLKNDFRDIRNKHQYAVLYVSPPNSRHGEVTYVPRTASVSQGNILTPNVNEANRNRISQNYAAATVDLHGRVFGDMLQRPNGNRAPNIHTEDVLLNLVFPGIERWYQENFHGSTIRNVYLYTFFLPCPNCYNIIVNFIHNNPGYRVFVGYTELYGGSREQGNVTRQLETRQRRNMLQNFLINNGGLLTQVNERGICSQSGNINRIGRDTSPICSASDKMLVIAMDFQNGKAEVWFAGLQPEYRGWIGLYDRYDNRVTWEYTNSKASGEIKFNYYMQNGYHVKYISNDRLLRKSSQWRDCGFDSVTMDALPYNSRKSPNSEADIKITVRGGYIIVQLQHSHYYQPNRNDYVAIESLEQIGTTNYVTYQWVSSFPYTGRHWEYSFNNFGRSLARGFRAKYVFYDGYRYRREGIYDNASPIWTPEECQGRN